MSSRRELEREQRLLRHLDLEEVLEELGLEVLWRNGSDAYLLCPDPNHVEGNPSFHVCVEDVYDARGRAHIGWFNCWSHPGGDLRSRSFLELVARVRSDVWGEDRWPTEEEWGAAASWLRRKFVRGGDAQSDEDARMTPLRRRDAFRRQVDWRELLWPPNFPIRRARREFRDYLLRRGVSLERAEELDVRAVPSSGEVLRGVLRETAPGVLFPIWEGGKPVNWYVRSIFKVPSRVKGRYCPGLPFVKDAGIIWAPDGVDDTRPVALVEGIFDAERVRAVILRNPGLSFVPMSNVVAVLGGRIYPMQARRLRTVPAILHLADGDAGGLNLFETVEGELGRFTRLELRQMPERADPGDAPEDAILAALRPPEDVQLVSVRFRVPPRRTA